MHSIKRVNINAKRLEKAPKVSKLRKKRETEIAISQQIERELNKEDICQSILKQGYVQSYIDFFYLTHRVDPHADEGQELPIEISLHDLLFIRDQLIKAENARRHSHFSIVSEALNELATYYHLQVKDEKTAIYFYEKCLQISRTGEDKEGEMNALHFLGKVYALLFNWELSRSYHEDHLAIAEENSLPEEVAKASRELFEVYMVLGKQEEQNEEGSDQSLLLYQLALDCAKNSWDRVLEGQAYSSLGKLCLLRGDAEQALSYLTDYDHLAKSMDDKEALCDAYDLLAQAYERSNQPGKAIQLLEKLMMLAQETRNANMEASASKSLGLLMSILIQNKQKRETKESMKEEEGEEEEENYHEEEKAKVVAMFQKRFDILSQINSSSDQENVSTEEVEEARTYVGLAKAKNHFEAYLFAARQDKGRLLNWKGKRNGMEKVRQANTKQQQT